jgi:uncharacterized iron-regulated protein
MTKSNPYVIRPIIWALHLRWWIEPEIGNLKKMKSVKTLVLAGLFAVMLLGSHVTNAQDKPIWLMGEIHDNEQGHFYRLQDLKSNVGPLERPAILMEQFDVSRQEALTKAWQTCKQAQCVIDAAGGSGWDWSLYVPLIDWVLANRLPLVAANLSRDQTQAVMKDGFSAVFDAATMTKYKLDKPLPQPWLDQQRRAIEQGHCNMLPAASIDPMVNAQAARDVQFAILIEQYASQGVVLIAGDAHVRRDLGVYQWLPSSLRDRVMIAGYVESYTKDSANYDRLRVLEPQARADMCDLFKRSQRQ